MKRGQLAAVLIIILLVAAVGGFVVFSAKKVGQATRPGTTQSLQNPLPQNVVTLPSPPKTNGDQRTCATDGTTLICKCFKALYQDLECNPLVYSNRCFAKIGEPTFELFIPGKNLCGDDTETNVAREFACKDAAKKRPECRITEAERTAAQTEIDRCYKETKETCLKNNGIFHQGPVKESTFGYYP